MQLFGELQVVTRRRRVLIAGRFHRMRRIRIALDTRILMPSRKSYWQYFLPVDIKIQFHLLHQQKVHHFFIPAPVKRYFLNSTRETRLKKHFHLMVYFWWKTFSPPTQHDVYKQASSSLEIFRYYCHIFVAIYSPLDRA